MKDYYYILGVKPDATATEIKAAYRKLSKKFHPDMNGGDTFFEERFKEIQEAHETLIDPSIRQRYDNSRNPYQEPPKAQKPTPPFILGFSINKTTLSSAEEFTVSWQTLHAETVTIQPFNIQVDANGSKSFRIPKLDAKLETIKIELIAQNRFGNVARRVEVGNLDWETPRKTQEVTSIPEEKLYQFRPVQISSVQKEIGKWKDWSSYLALGGLFLFVFFLVVFVLLNILFNVRSIINDDVSFVLGIILGCSFPIGMMAYIVLSIVEKFTKWLNL